MYEAGHGGDLTVMSGGGRFVPTTVDSWGGGRSTNVLGGGEQQKKSAAVEDMEKTDSAVAIVLCMAPHGIL
jgi:hypothetical protein